jgi:hypothetical protein
MVGSHSKPLTEIDVFDIIFYFELIDLSKFIEG